MRVSTAKPSDLFLMLRSHDPQTGLRRRLQFPSFNPILAGATLRERLLGCLGALIAIALTGLICGASFGIGPHLPLIVAPMGASAVLLFAVPNSPLAQPWSIIGGNTISALMGIIAGHFIQDPVMASGVGVSLAIGAMSFTRCLHPPGGAAALTAVLGGPAVASWGLLFPFVPVALNSCILVAFGFLFHKLSRRAYPHVATAAPANTHLTADHPSSTRLGFRSEDVDAALAALDETFDIDRDDLGRLLQQVELQATIRRFGPILCEDIMSKDVIMVNGRASAADARALLLRHNIRTLPVVNDSGRLMGSVGLRELSNGAGTIAAALSPITTAIASPTQPALSLLPALTDGRTHAVIIVDKDRHVIGLMSQTDLLSVIARALPRDPASHGEAA
jgi:CBS domain-containing membrane protein